MDAVKKIAEKTEGDPAERQQEPDVIPENIIMIMNESLADFESIGSVRSDVEILPYIHSIDKDVYKRQEYTFPNNLCICGVSYTRYKRES